jgi:hypothetical protein
MSSATTGPNSWILSPESTNTSDVDAHMPPAPHLSVQPAGIRTPDAEFLLPVRMHSRGARLWWVGAHGGAAETTFAALHPDDEPSGHAWPALESGHPPTAVVIARTNHSGLLAAQHASRHWASRTLPDLQLLGVVLVADAPGRLPRSLSSLATVVAGGFPRHWDIPWIPQWREGQPIASTRVPAQLTKLQRDLDSLTAPPQLAQAGA